MTNSIQKIVVSNDEMETTRRKLLDHFTESLGSSDEAALKTEEILLRAIEGWPRGPKTFKARIAKLARLGSAPQNGSSKSRTQAEEKKLWQEVKDLLNLRKYRGNVKDLFDEYTDTEKKMWLEREKFYYEEFEFNQSSDFSPLLSLLADEIQLMRLHVLQLRNPEKDYSKKISEAHKRIMEAQKILGITRVQREAAEDKTEGIITNLVNNLQRKLQNRAKMKEKEKEKEEYFSQIKRERPEEYRGIRTVTDITDADIKLLDRQRVLE